MVSAYLLFKQYVALRKESVDRNNHHLAVDLVESSVALRKESVDRNMVLICAPNALIASLSARRAWIEILCIIPQPRPICVALRKESVDRNTDVQHISPHSARVALRKESVDRNCRVRLCPVCQWRSLSARRAWIEIDWASVITAMTSRRSPQGERG